MSASSSAVVSPLPIAPSSADFTASRAELRPSSMSKFSTPGSLARAGSPVAADDAAAGLLLLLLLLGDSPASACSANTSAGSLSSEALTRGGAVVGLSSTLLGLPALSSTSLALQESVSTPWSCALVSVKGSSGTRDTRLPAPPTSTERSPSKASMSSPFFLRASSICSLTPPMSPPTNSESIVPSWFMAFPRLVGSSDLRS
mmetsp:Transcript_31491/g.89387  ORF Transcript_31491/g.89387 Transcript_31491/m.89387 type:complete len:202 (+) Transcript_31491:587-1192(+)